MWVHKIWSWWIWRRGKRIWTWGFGRAFESPMVYMDYQNSDSLPRRMWNICWPPQAVFRSPPQLPLPLESYYFHSQYRLNSRVLPKCLFRISHRHLGFGSFDYYFDRKFRLICRWLEERIPFSNLFSPASLKWSPFWFAITAVEEFPNFWQHETYRTKSWDCPRASRKSWRHYAYPEWMESQAYLWS